MFNVGLRMRGGFLCRRGGARVYSEIVATAQKIDLRKSEFITTRGHKSLGVQCHAETYLSTEPPPPREDPRVPYPYEDQIRRRRTQPPPRQGPSQDRRERRLPGLVSRTSSVCFSLPGATGFPQPVALLCSLLLESDAPAMSPTPNSVLRLRRHADYQRVYTSSRKQFSKQMSFFYSLRPAQGPDGKARRSDTTRPRVGLTVGKVMGQAVDRNRIKLRLRA